MLSRFYPSRMEIVLFAVAAAILAVRVGPHLAEADGQEQISRMIDRLHAIRVNLDCYKAAHDNHLPPLVSFEDFEAAIVMTSRKWGCPIRRIPANPFNNSRLVRLDGEPAGSNLAGWRLDTDTGRLQADNNYICAGL